MSEAKKLTSEEKEIFQQVVELGNKLNAMVGKTHEIKRSCHKLENENQYLQDYVGNLMSTDILSKK
ncbi:hypothetical protein DASC09_058710 [Saccharomycopsis crataegensis]|uniref:Uncharacterized protein n=1 Tax=Saccharomycopsis crataegensis TaxID=43959 RepID=A0AAV5QUD9_9ASCO|nr:hypothetical protein DASC09_058710 [Saccharomycopsis crataegensis]